MAVKIKAKFYCEAYGCLGEAELERSLPIGSGPYDSTNNLPPGWWLILSGDGKRIQYFCPKKHKLNSRVAA